MTQELSTEEIEKLVEQAQEGDSEAFARVYDRFVDPIYRYIFFRVRKDDALDLTENVFLKVWENLKNYRRNEGNATFSSWIYRIAHNIVVDYYRLNRQYEELDANTPDEKKSNDPVLQAERSISSTTLKIAMSKLKKTYQQVILLKYINELENHEIARIIGKTEGALRIIKFRALKALKQVLESMNVKL